MTDTEPTLEPATDAGIDEPTRFRMSVMRHAGSALLIVGAVGLIFWGLGPPSSDSGGEFAGSEDRGEVIIGGPPPDRDGPADAPDDVDDQGASDEDPDATGEQPDPDIDTEPDPDADTGTGAGTEDQNGAESGAGEPSASPEDEAPQDPPGDDVTGEDPGEAEGDDEPVDTDTTTSQGQTIDPATVTVQVLDGYQNDGGAAADAVADSLVAEGYDLIARNPALLYDVTTVLYTAGHEAAAQQVAAFLGAGIREQPGSLSTDVAVHVVVGADRG